MLNKICKTFILSFGLLVGLSFVIASKIYLYSDMDNISLDCPTNIDIMIDTQGEEIFGASVNIVYDRKNIQIDGFYLNEDFNLPLDIEIKEYDDFANIKAATLSLIRNSNFQQVGFSGLVKFATIVLKNKEPIDSTKIDFLFSGEGITTDNMDVFRLGDAKDILKEVEGGTFNFVQGDCSHTSPDGLDQLDENYDFRSHLDKNLKNIGKNEKFYGYKLMFLNCWYWILIIILILILIWIMYKKGLLNNLGILKNKKNKND